MGTAWIPYRIECTSSSVCPGFIHTSKEILRSSATFVVAVILLSSLPYATPQFLPVGQTSTGTGFSSPTIYYTPTGQYQFQGQPIQGQQSFVQQQVGTPSVFQQDVSRQQRIITSPFVGMVAQDPSQFQSQGQQGFTGQNQGAFVAQQQPQFMVQPVFQQQGFPQVFQGQQFSPQFFQTVPSDSSGKAIISSSDTSTGAGTGTGVGVGSDATQQDQNVNTRGIVSSESAPKDLKKDTVAAAGSADSSKSESETSSTSKDSKEKESKSEKSVPEKSEKSVPEKSEKSVPEKSVKPEKPASTTSSKLTASNATAAEAKNQTLSTRALGSESANSPRMPEGISKSELFSRRATISDPTSLAALKSQVKLSRFQIWWLTNQILPKMRDNLRPDYIFMLPSPFQQGIPSINISQVMSSPVVRPEVVRALIDNADGMLVSQLSVILQRLRLSAPILIKDIMSSKNPSVLLSMINPREMQKNMRVIIKTITEMPETGRFGITSVHAKLLPTNLLTTWLHFFNLTKWNALDILGQSPLGAANELQLAILGLTCADIRTLPPMDVLPVVNQFRRELYNLRQFQPNLDYPLGMRRCILEKVLEFLVMKSTQGQGPQTNSAGHILDNLEISDVKAIGGEVLTAIPSAALRKANIDTQRAIIEEIGRLDIVTLLSFAQPNKLQWLASQLVTTFDTASASSDTSDASSSDTSSVFKPRAAGGDLEDLPEGESTVKSEKAATTETAKGNKESLAIPIIPAADVTKGTDNKAMASDPAAKIAADEITDTEITAESNPVSSEAASPKEGSSKEASPKEPSSKETSPKEPSSKETSPKEPSSKETSAKETSKETSPKEASTKETSTKSSTKEASSTESSTKETSPKEAEKPKEFRSVDEKTEATEGGKDNKTEALLTRDRRSTESNLEILDHLGSLYCYSTSLVSGSLSSDKEVLRDFLDQKENVGEKTCCLTKVERVSWAKFLKTVYGDNVSSWNEFDILSVGDLLLTLTEDEINAISIDSLAKVATTLIRQSGLVVPMRQAGSVEKKSFVKSCISILDEREEDIKAVQEFIVVYKAYLRKLSQAIQWMLLGSGEAGSGIQLAGQSSVAPTGSNTGDLKITCDALTMAGPAALGYTVTDLKQMDAQELFDCIETLGKVDWDEDVKAELISFFKEKFHLSSQQLNILTLIEFGKLVSAVPSKDLAEIPLVVPGSLDIIAVLGDHITDPDTLQILASKFIKDNHLVPSSFSSRTPRSNNMRVTVRSMGNILCGFAHNILNSLLESDSGLLLDTSPDVGLAQGCSHDSLALLASHAVRPANYGPTETWTVVDVRTLGVIVAGLATDRLAKIPPDSMEGLTGLAIKSFPSTSIRALTVDQITRIPLGTALAMDFSQVEELTKEQKDALEATVGSHQNSFFLDPKFLSSASSVSVGANSFSGFGTIGVKDTESGEDSLKTLEARSAHSSELESSKKSSSNSTDAETAVSGRSVTDEGSSSETLPSNGTIEGETTNSTAMGNGTHLVVDTENKTIDIMVGSDDGSANEGTTKEPPPHSEGDVSKPGWQDGDRSHDHGKSRNGGEMKLLNPMLLSLIFVPLVSSVLAL